ncbi:MAG: SLBB domain-containing protein [Candidatus Hydrogenedentes bacterium]|nr:SLBB domain-containing protein [Candidatus Hydrogenedentota bacterium]
MGKRTQVTQYDRCLCSLLSLVTVLAGGCATAPTPAAPEAAPSSSKVLSQAPTAQEMEGPLHANGTNGGPKVTIQRHEDSVIEESARMRTVDVKGSAFPGVDVDMSRIPGEPAPAAAPAAVQAAAPAADEAARERLAEVESRLQALQAQVEASRAAAGTAGQDRLLEELQARLDALEGRPPQVVQITPDNYRQEIQGLEERLAQIEGRPAETMQTTPDNYGETLAALESRLAALENRPPQVVQVDPANAPDLSTVESRLAALENRPPQVVQVESASAPDLSTVESRLAALENRPPQVVQVTPQEYGQELEAVEARLAELEHTAAASPQEPTAEYAAELATLERRLAALEQVEAEPVVVQEPNDATVQRLESMESQLAEMRVAIDRGNEMQVTDPAPADAPGPRTVDVHVEAARVDDYLIGAGDVLEFQSFNDETLTRPLTVRFDGYISLPLIPDQRVAGLSREDAERQVRQAYTRVFRDPQLALVVQTTASKTFTVMGDVERPAHYPYLKTYTLLEAITEAGGLRNRSASSSVGGFIGVTGQLTKAYIIRREAGERQVYEYDLRHLGRPGYHASEAPVFPGDLVYVPPGTNLVYVLGESRNPVIVELTEGMTMLQMLALSGGFNASTAQLRNVILIREVDDQNSDILNINVRKLLKGGGRIPLQPGDIIYLPQKRLVRLQEFVSRVTGSIAPWLDLYQSAVSSYYARDLNQIILDSSEQNNTLRVLGEIEQFGRTTDNIVNLYRSP